MIDVLRWSSVVITALANGAAWVEAYATPDEVRARATAFVRDQVLLGGERGNVALPGFDVGNSPLDYTAARVEGRTVLTTTTNGTQALHAADGAAARLVGAFVNRSATVEAVRRALTEPASVTGRITLLCAGQAGEEAHEDTAFAGALAVALAARLGDPGLGAGDEATAHAVRRWQAADCDAAHAVALAPHASALRAQGFGEDIRSCGSDDAIAQAVREQNGRLMCWSDNGAVGRSSTGGV
ncbi:MAG: 2-phosphosulfolactate phosphatase [Gemmatimonadaceae bacterium]|nr:2-phosphosulfolactate phosphatase [Gemmatimonadaceae bacterium]